MCEVSELKHNPLNSFERNRKKFRKVIPIAAIGGVELSTVEGFAERRRFSHHLHSPYLSQSLSLPIASPAQADLLEFDHSVFGSHWRW